MKARSIIVSLFVLIVVSVTGLAQEAASYQKSSSGSYAAVQAEHQQWLLQNAPVTAMQTTTQQQQQQYVPVIPLTTVRQTRYDFSGESLMYNSQVLRQLGRLCYTTGIGSYPLYRTTERSILTRVTHIDPGLSLYLISTRALIL